MARKKNNGDSGGGLPPWMATYGDLVTLLLCFFVLLFAFSTIDAQKYRDAVTSFKGTFGVLEGGQGVLPANSSVTGSMDKQGTSQKYNSIAKKLKKDTEVLSKEQLKNLQENLDIKITERGIVIGVEEKLLFQSGQADLKDEAASLLEIVFNTISKIPNHVVIEGHTDSIPIKSSKFPSNWELSAARAASVARYFEDIDTELVKRVSIAGYADTKPKANNSTVQGRSANRRVDIIILKTVDEQYIEKHGTESPVE